MKLLSKQTTLLSLGMVALLAATVMPANAWCLYDHPRRAEVLGRDAAIRRELNYDRGFLGGHYGQLRHEDMAIARQEQRDAFFNGGYITRGEQIHLNREENRLQRRINRDFY